MEKVCILRPDERFLGYIGLDLDCCAGLSLRSGGGVSGRGGRGRS